MSYIKELGATFVIGAFFIVGLALMLNWLLDKRYIKRFFSKNQTDKKYNLKQIFVLFTIPALALCYTTGIILEDTSDYCADQPSFSFRSKIILSALMFWFPREGQLKKEVLFSTDSELTKLGKEVAKAHLFSRFGDKYYRCGFKILEDVVLDYPCLKLTELGIISNDPILKELKNTSLTIYYTAKNTVYREENYFKELMDIQYRINFTRSLALGSILLFYLTLFLGFFQIIFKKRCEIRKAAAWLISILLVLHILGLGTYVHEEKQFNKRIFGYFLLLDKSQKNKSEVVEIRETGPTFNF